MYTVTLIEIIIFIVIGSIISEGLLKHVYQRFGVSYTGNIGVVFLGVSFLLFCLYTLFRTYILSVKNALLKERMTSFTFWIVFIWSAYSIFSPFMRGSL